MEENKYPVSTALHKKHGKHATWEIDPKTMTGKYLTPKGEIAKVPLTKEYMDEVYARREEQDQNVRDANKRLGRPENEGLDASNPLITKDELNSLKNYIMDKITPRKFKSISQSEVIKKNISDDYAVTAKGFDSPKNTSFKDWLIQQKKSGVDARLF